MWRDLKLVSKHYKFKSPLDPDLLSLTHEQIGLLMADIIIDMRMKRISEIEEKYRRESDSVVEGSKVTSVRGKSLRVSTASFGGERFYTDKEIIDILENPDISDVWGLSSSSDSDEELVEALGGEE